MTVPDIEHGADTVRFRGGWGMAFVPLAVFVVTCVIFFGVFQTFDSYTLVAFAFVGLLFGGVLAKNYEAYWKAVFSGIGSPTAATIVAILFVVGMYSQLIKVTGLSEGIAWLASVLHVGTEWYVLFVFLATCMISLSTGSSIGAMITAFPVFYAAGLPLGVSAVVMGGAIISGALFGDNLAPTSDTTIISAAAQRFRSKPGYADIGGVVSSRARYALVTAGISAVVYTVLGFATSSGSSATVVGDPAGLWMLVPVVGMLVIAIVTRNIFAAVTVGLVLGTVVALVTGLLPASGIAGVQEGAAAGFLIEGAGSMASTVVLALSVFGIMGVLTGSGVLERLTGALVRSRWARTPRGAEAVIGASTAVLTVAFGGVNGAAMMTLGPVVDEVGSRVGLHPYRRSNIMDCFAMGTPSVVPFISAFLFIAAGLTMGFDVPPLTPVELASAAVYPMVLTVVMIVAVATGWGRRFEAPDGQPVAARPVGEPVAVPAGV